jgi:NAD(P)-dependent dehydrogenase (short-subunit alcohol dehydrogenase family)
MTQQAHNPLLAVVTGATGMLGSATVRALASRGVSTILIVRDEAKGRALVDQLNVPRTDTHHLVVGDLSEPRSVRDIAGRVWSETDDIAVLIHAAAALFRQRRVNSAGHEAMFATNVLSRFLLTHELQPLLAKGTAGRVINVTGPSPDRLDFDDLMAETNFNAFRQFRATNAANLQLAFELAHRARGTGVTSNAYTPGALQSDLMTEMPALIRLITIPFGRNADGAQQRWPTSPSQTVTPPPTASSTNAPNQHAHRRPLSTPSRSGGYGTNAHATSASLPRLAPAMPSGEQTAPPHPERGGHDMKIGVHIVDFSLPGGPPRPARP